MTYRVGVDIGSTTVKTVVLDATGTIIFRAYERHFSRVREKAAEQLLQASKLLSDKQVHFAITGSAGLGAAKSMDLPFVQEVYATAAAVDKYIENTDAVIELGGEDAKIIFFKGGLEERMNGSCAGGTGAFIDQMATLLNVSADELDALSLNYNKIYPIASRCGVFAKSDIQALLNQGAGKEDISVSIFQAVVDQTIAGLTQGRELTGKIVFLGGPLTFLKGMRQRFTETLKLDSEHAVFPENADCYAAIGAALCADDTVLFGYKDLLEKLRNSAVVSELSNTMEPLFESEEEYRAFAQRHAMASPEMVDIAVYTGKAYLGIDAGSTTTKLVLIEPSGGILYSYYSSNFGNPVSVVLEQLKKIYELCGDRIVICGCATTGYGEELIKNAFDADIGLVETMAHYRAAKHFSPDVDFIIDIGGQDIKCFKIRNGAIDSIMLNEACSSGCGSFIETFAKALGYDVASFARLGLLDKHPVNLGSRCTVFMNSSVKQAQKEGATIENISAGISESVVKNAIYKVIRASSAQSLGKHIVVQGGTFLNDAVLRAFEKEVGMKVTRPTIAGLMGAYGAALSVADKGLEHSNIRTEKQLESFVHTAKTVNCGLCTNHCGLTVNTFDEERKFISGNRCSKPVSSSKSLMPSMYRYKYEKLSVMHGKGTGDGSRGKIGIPFGLNMYENLPFWFEFFTALNFEVVLSPRSSRELYIKGQMTIPSDTVCYPAKLIHGHIEALIEMGVQNIFYPCMPYNFNERLSDNHYNCPVVAYYPELIGANVKRLQSVKYMMPYFGLHRPRDFAKRAGEYFEQQLGVPKAETRKAVDMAYKAYENYRKDLCVTAEKMIDDARKNNNHIIVVAGRPYHIDPEINHGIDELIGSLGLVLISEDAIALKSKKPQVKVLNQWTYQARMYAAADYVCENDDMDIVQLVSFGCGTDAITGDEMRSMLEAREKIYTQIKIDDISNMGAVKIRLRSLTAALEARGESNGRA